ncbi:MAG TPA: ATP-binding protein [Gemmatimonadaceae bacterium]|nr:ATP-binding protein [Gemmatimonadaceae bacterium]
MPWVELAIAFLVIVLVVMRWASLILQNTAAAYVGAESQWSKGQKSAVITLYQAAARDTIPDLGAFEAALTVPMADRRGRLALERSDADYALATREFIAGGSVPSDASAMAHLFPIFSRVPVVRVALRYWEHGDTDIDSLRTLARALVVAGENRKASAILLDRVRAFDEHLTREELGFSGALGEATRQLALGLGISTLIVGVGLGIGVIVLTRRSTRNSAIAAEADRRRIEEFRALVEDAPDAIARLDLGGRHVFANTMLAQTLGLQPAEMEGRTHAEIGEQIGAPPDFADRWQEGIAAVGATRAASSFEVTMPSPAGDREFAIRLAPQLDAAGAVESVIAVARDITDIRASARALRERDEQLQHAQKIEAVGQLAGGIAHDFNNILTAIIGNLDLALAELPEHSSAREDVEEAIASSRRATSLTRQLLTFGRRQFVEATRVDLNAMVVETLGMLSRLVGTRIHIETNCAIEALPVNVDVTQLQQVLVNLVVNARDAMPDGGTIVIETNTAIRDEGPYALLTVTDTGTGMSAETRARVFEPFFTTKPRGQGTGLGLSIVHGIVAASGGSIELESAPSQGTELRVRLPLLEPEPCGSPRVSGPRSIIPETQHLTILLVEDEAAVRNTARRALERAGHVVVEAQHAEDALVHWRRKPESFDIVVTDLMMPGMDGWALLRTLRADRPLLPAVVMSGYTGTRDDADLLTNRAVTLTLSKPFGPRELADLVQRAMLQLVDA